MVKHCQVIVKVADKHVTLPDLLERGTLNMIFRHNLNSGVMSLIFYLICIATSHN